MSDIPLIVLDEHPDWLNPLYAEFRNQGIPFQKVDISSAAYNPLETEVMPFYVNRLSPSATKRSHQSAFNYTLNYIQHLELFGARVINGSHAVLWETSKAQQASLLKKLNIPYPKTIVLNDFKLIPQFIDQFHFPVVIKPNCGGSGMGIQKFASKEELLSALETNTLMLPEERMVLLQEFIQPKDNYIVRVETVNGKVIYAMKVFTQDTFNLCPSDSCDMSRTETSSDSMGYCVASPTDSVRFELFTELPIEVKDAVEKIVKEAHLECAGIEYVVDSKNDWFIYDVNALSILRSSFKQEYGIDGWKILADFFIAEYRKSIERLKERTNHAQK